jgi:hypothetical protein
MLAALASKPWEGVMRIHRWRGAVGRVLACGLLLSAAASARAAGVRIVDGGVIDAAQALRAASVAHSQQLIPLDQKVDINGEQWAYSGPLSFDWTSDTVSVLVYEEPRPGDSDILTAIDDRRPERPHATGPSASFVLPGSDMPVSAGSYAFEIAASGNANAAEVILFRRRGPQPSSGTLDVNLFVLEGSGLDRADLEKGMGHFAQTFADAKIKLGSVTLITVTGAEELLSVPSSTSAGSPLRQLGTLSSLASNSSAANLFFVREITTEDADSGLFGISLGIPAALGISGTISSGVVVNVSAHNLVGGFDTREFGQTITHETGHSLGLFHTSEKDGSLHDPISDTPECTGADPLDAAACPDGANLMFWSGRDFKVTAGQGYVLLRSPIVK